MSVSLTSNNMTVSPVDALWTLYMSQTKSVRKEFTKRLEAQTKSEKLAKKIKEYEKNLTPEEIANAHELAQTIKTAVREIEEARAQGKPYGTPIDDFFLELENEGM